MSEVQSVAPARASDRRRRFLVATGATFVATGIVTLGLSGLAAANASPHTGSGSGGCDQQWCAPTCDPPVLNDDHVSGSPVLDQLVAIVEHKGYGSSSSHMTWSSGSSTRTKSHPTCTKTSWATHSTKPCPTTSEPSSSMVTSSTASSSTVSSSTASSSTVSSSSTTTQAIVAPSSSASTQALAYTGTDVSAMALAALAMVGLGGGMLVIARRRTTAATRRH